MNKDLLLQYLSGKLEKPAAREVVVWMALPENEMLVRSYLTEIWEENRVTIKGPVPDFDSMLHSIHNRIALLNDDVPEQTLRRQSPVQRFLRGFQKVAAVLLIPLMVFTAWWFGRQYLQTDSQKLTYREIFTKPGCITKVELADGTEVWLNDGTRLRYPEKFERKERRVFVDGEAYFKVTHNAKRPFIVENPLMTTTVTGTEFNLNAYSQDGYFEATLTRGHIALSSDHISKKVDIKPGEQARLNLENKSFTIEPVNPMQYAAWREGKLIFVDEKLDIAVKKLSRWYNVDIILADDVLKDMPITATFRKEQLMQTLGLLKKALPIRYEITAEKQQADQTYSRKQIKIYAKP